MNCTPRKKIYQMKKKQNTLADFVLFWAEAQLYYNTFLYFYPGCIFEQSENKAIENNKIKNAVLIWSIWIVTAAVTNFSFYSRLKQILRLRAAMGQNQWNLWFDFNLQHGTWQ